MPRILTANPKSHPAWIILAQSHSVTFQEMMDDLAGSLGHGLLLTGRSGSDAPRNLTVKTMPAYDRGPLHRRALSWAQFMATAAPLLAAQRGRPFLLAVTNPPLNPHLAWMLSRTKGMPYGLLMWDIYPDAFYKHRMLDAGNPLVGTWRHMNARAMLEAKFVVTLGERMKSVLEAQLCSRAAEARLEVIPNWVDTGTIKPLTKPNNPFSREHGLANKTTVLYSGNIGAGHGVEILPVAADEFRDDENVRFVVIGSGLGLSALEGEVRGRGLRNITLLPPQPWERFPLAAASGDIAVVFQRPGLEDISMPSKTYTALSAGSAILAVTSEDSDLGRLVRNSNVGLVVDHRPASVAEGLRQMIADPAGLSEMQRRAKSLAEREFDTSVVQKRWLDLLGEHVGNRQRRRTHG